MTAETTKLFQQAKKGLLPEDFNQWGLVNDRGWSIAYTAAINNNLPANFNNWELADIDGWTIAHDIALTGNLPVDFTGWELADNDGITVRQVKASYDNLLKLPIY